MYAGPCVNLAWRTADMIAIRGVSSEIAKALIRLLPAGEFVHAIKRGGKAPTLCDRYLFCGGLLYAKTQAQQTRDERAESMAVNFFDVREDCERIIAANDSARIVVLGSESGFTGSYDGTYAQAKRELHNYVETRRLRTPTQQLVCVAPSIIEDAGMTTRRADKANLERRKMEHPKRRFLRSGEVARLIHFVLYQDAGYLTNVVLRMNGGSHAYLLKAVAA